MDEKYLFEAITECRVFKTAKEMEIYRYAGRVGAQAHLDNMAALQPEMYESQIESTFMHSCYFKGACRQFSFIPICASGRNSSILHYGHAGAPNDRLMHDGDWLLMDMGTEYKCYACDITTVCPVNGKFTQRQLEIYQIVEACHDYVLEVAKPGVKYKDVHLAVCRLMTDRLKELGLMKGDTDEAVNAGAHAMFLPHGLGHMMGMDVHDMEGLGQVYVGFDDETRSSVQFGTNALRMGRRLEEGFVVTDEPGIYFIPALIDDWKAQGLHKDFINYDLLETYKDFGGIRIEDDILITADGCRFLGSERIPYHPKDVEAFMADN